MMHALCGRCREAVLRIVKTEAVAVSVDCAVEVREGFVFLLNLTCFLLVAFS